MDGQEPCIRLLVLTVEKNVKYHSSPQKEGQSTVENAIKDTGRRDETEDISKQYLISQKSYIISNSSLFFV